ncbi:MAG TPA: dTMP kinase [Candidatus Pacebacteria bacterium]|nr:dTMP kinase [Candidatus Paceibacterota bacterium]
MSAKIQGYLITFEGGEGAGKTTQVAKLKQRFQTLGREVVVLREPGGTVISEQIRDVVLGKKNLAMADTTEVLLFQAARAQIYQELVIPALKAGKVVLMDRSRDSSVVYQGMVRGFGRRLIEQLNNISTQKTVPNLTLLLDVPVKIGLKRRRDTGETDRLDNQAQSFHDQVRQAYLTLAKENHLQRWQVVDASQPVEKVEQALWQIIETKLKLS